MLHPPLALPVVAQRDQSRKPSSFLPRRRVRTCQDNCDETLTVGNLQSRIVWKAHLNDGEGVRVMLTTNYRDDPALSDDLDFREQRPS